MSVSSHAASVCSVVACPSRASASASTPLRDDRGDDRGGRQQQPEHSGQSARREDAPGEIGDGLHCLASLLCATRLTAVA